MQPAPVEPTLESCEDEGMPLRYEIVRWDEQRHLMIVVLRESDLADQNIRE